MPMAATKNQKMAAARTGSRRRASSPDTACVVTMAGDRDVTATFDAAPTLPCASATSFTGTTGNFGTTGTGCYKTSRAVNGWGCANFTGRTVSVNGGAATSACGAGPFPLARASDGNTYFAVTAGAYPWASIYTW